ncbi:MAG: hypothetical protein FWC73_09730 [Defluviitaleaceae bacterium]|nr:hypothetical protein [Defluviitaleaceae bacterium]
MRKKLFAVVVALIIVFSSVVSVFAGPIGGGAEPPILPRSLSLCIQCNFCICDDDDIVMLRY